MCDDPQHDPTPVLDAVREQPGMGTEELNKALYRQGVTNQPARIGLAVSARLIHRKREGKTVRHYPGPHPRAGKANS